MKLETTLLTGLFVTCFVACVLIFGAMVNASPSREAAANALTTTSATCALLADGVVCPRSAG